MLLFVSRNYVYKLLSCLVGPSIDKLIYLSMHVHTVLVMCILFRRGHPSTEDEKNNKIKQAILLLFDRPNEPIFLPKGPKNTVFVLPDHYWVRNIQLSLFRTVKAMHRVVILNIHHLGP